MRDDNDQEPERETTTTWNRERQRGKTEKKERRREEWWKTEKRVRRRTEERNSRERRKTEREIAERVTKTSPLILSSSTSSSTWQRTMDAKHDELVNYVHDDRVWWRALSFKKQGLRRWKTKLWELRWMKRWLKAMIGYGLLERSLLTKMIMFSYVFKLM